MDFCINCIHFLSKLADPKHEYARCGRRGTPNPVTGIMSFPYCNSERTYSTGTCPDGKHFQQTVEKNNE